jgi:hypothetical protein
MAVVLTIHFAGPGTDRLSFRPILATGFVILAFGTGALGFGALPGTVLAATAWAIVARGGMGMVYCALNTGATRVVPDALLPQVPGATNFFRILGGGLGVKAVSMFMGSGTAGTSASRVQASTSGGDFSGAFLFMSLLGCCALLTAWQMHPSRPAD